MIITEQMVDAADEAFDNTYEADIEVGSSHWSDNRKVALTAALTAALAVSGYGEAFEALVKLRTEAWWMAKQLSSRKLPGVAGDSVDRALDAARDAIARISANPSATRDIVSQGN